MNTEARVQEIVGRATRVLALFIGAVVGVSVARAQPSALDRLLAGAAALQQHAERALAELDASARPRAVPTGLFAFSLAEDGRSIKTPLSAQAPLADRLAVLVHGLDDPGDIWLELAPALINAGITPVAFEYLNDDSPAKSADALAAALRELRSRGVRRIDLVCHSMGGLLARDVLTRGNHYAGRGNGHDDLPDVGRLMMLGTPHHGSALARLRAFTEIREQVLRWTDSKDLDPRILLGFVTDGLGGAGKDLLPGSAYLTELNQRPAPSGVEMTCVVGVLTSPPEPTDLEWITQAPIVRELVGQSEADMLGSALRDLTSALGDGCVTEESASLTGVADTVKVEASHRGMLRSMRIERAARRVAGQDEHEAPPAVAIVLDRLTTDRSKTDE